MGIIDNLKKSFGVYTEDDIRDEELGAEPDNSFEVPISITPEQTIIDIILIRPRNADDIDYINDQIVSEKNPVIVDLAYLENEGPELFQMAISKIKFLREKYNAEAISLSRTDDKYLILIAPTQVNITKRD
ncbi:cell division protein SepF [Methanobrevibacter curvatus]|uniref:Cell division protein SepF n=1 Tax=Methanobrevibacter curvatus TaxID=49547 RepID=A0A165ZDL3_9EURY|nr:cell division protein SepF [Methanobrevibacter curvatus]KZX10581.1 hypothetical protein MBCUR_17380 [Methanobrevibacter curvatus]